MNFIFKVIDICLNLTLKCPFLVFCLKIFRIMKQYLSQIHIEVYLHMVGNRVCGGCVRIHVFRNAFKHIFGRRETIHFTQT